MATSYHEALVGLQNHAIRVHGEAGYRKRFDTATGSHIVRMISTVTGDSAPGNLRSTITGLLAYAEPLLGKAKIESLTHARSLLAGMMEVATALGATPPAPSASPKSASSTVTSSEAAALEAELAGLPTEDLQAIEGVTKSTTLYGRSRLIHELKQRAANKPTGPAPTAAAVTKQIERDAKLADNTRFKNLHGVERVKAAIAEQTGNRK